MGFQESKQDFIGQIELTSKLHSLKLTKRFFYQIINAPQKCDLVKSNKVHNNNKMINEIVNGILHNIQTYLYNKLMIHKFNSDTFLTSLQIYLNRTIDTLFSTSIEYTEKIKSYMLVDTIIEVLETESNILIVFLERLLNDWEVICRLLGNEEMIVLAIEAKGDRHYLGERVIKIYTNKKNFFYKPRNLENEIIFSKITDLVNSITKTQYLGKCNVVQRNQYGWTNEIIEETREFKREVFFTSIGKINAIIDVFNIVDIHEENIIFSEKGAILVDLECMFYPLKQKLISNYDVHMFSEEIIKKSIPKDYIMDTSDVLLMDDAYLMTKKIIANNEDVINALMGHNKKEVRLIFRESQFCICQLNNGPNLN